MSTKTKRSSNKPTRALADLTDAEKHELANSLKVECRGLLRVEYQPDMIFNEDLINESASQLIRCELDRWDECTQRGIPEETPNSDAMFLDCRKGDLRKQLVAELQRVREVYNHLIILFSNKPDSGDGGLKFGTPSTIPCENMPPLKVEIRDEAGRFIRYELLIDPREEYAKACSRWNPSWTCNAVVGEPGFTCLPALEAAENKSAA